MGIDWAKLREPFPAKDVEWRIQAQGNSGGKIWARVLAYITNRAIQDRLDSVVGVENWRNEFQKAPDGGVMCGISIRVESEWITKWDGAENTDVEGVKGGLSNSMKRAGVQWGIGRYLYNLEAEYAIISPSGKHYAQTKDKTPFKWDQPALPPWALPVGEEREVKTGNKTPAQTSEIVQLKQTLIDYLNADTPVFRDPKAINEFIADGNVEKMREAVEIAKKRAAELSAKE